LVFRYCFVLLRFGYLIATNEDLNKVYFVAKSFLGGTSKTMEIDKASLEGKLLWEELHLHGKGGRFTFKFDDGCVSVASVVVGNLERRLADPPPTAARASAALTAIFAFIVWWAFLVCHVLNNITGFGSRHLRLGSAGSLSHTDQRSRSFT
jgi:hypothetical protein